MIPKMIHKTTKCPEQHPIPVSFRTSFVVMWDPWGKVDLLPLWSRIGRCEGAPFSAEKTILGLPRIIIDPWKDLWSICGVPGILGTWYMPEFDISAMDRARRTVVAPLITEGGTLAGPWTIWGPKPYKAARGIADWCIAWWCTGQGSPSQVWDMGGMEGTMFWLAANMGTLWTLLMEPLGAMRNCGGAMGPISWGICCMGYPGIAGYPYCGGYL